jgi:hypothetical protein
MVETMIDRFVYFLFIVTNIMLCVLVTVDMYQGKKALEEINSEFKTVHDNATKFSNDLADMDKHVNDIHYGFKTFENFPPNLTDLEKRN